MLVKNLWNQVGIEILLEIKYDDKLQKLHSFGNKLVEEVVKRVEPIASREVVRVVKKKTESTLECIIIVSRSLSVALMLFYLTSLLYNYIRYPISPEKFYICEEKAFVKIKELENICSREIIGHRDVVAEETYVKEFIEKAVKNLKNTVSILKETLSNIETVHST
uniref:Uncharacterized protein n=1 Tax=Staphylothermus marinus TaxID=2280 RepID=A0A7C4DB55_STAMA